METTSDEIAAPSREDLRAERIYRAKHWTGMVLRYAVLIVLAVFTAYPFYWTFIISVSTGGNVFEFPPPLLPTDPGLKFYQTVWSEFSVGRWILNSFFLSGLDVIGTLLVCSLAAYPLARMRFPGRQAVFVLIIATLMLPVESRFIANYITLTKLGLVNTWAGVVLPGLAGAFGIFLMRQAYLAVPQELIDAARVDGAGELRIWWQIMVPTTVPAMTALAVFAFVNSWTSFIWPYIVLKTPDLYPMSVGILYLNGQFQTNTRLVAAGSVIALIPVLLIFLYAQKYFVSSMEGAVKQ
jgi:putative chitobiose transport system permease protein